MKKIEYALGSESYIVQKLTLRESSASLIHAVRIGRQDQQLSLSYSFLKPEEGVFNTSSLGFVTDAPQLIQKLSDGTA